MRYLFKYTATKNTCVDSVNVGEISPIEKGSNTASGDFLVNRLRKISKEVKITLPSVGRQIKLC